MSLFEKTDESKMEIIILTTLFCMTYEYLDNVCNCRHSIA